LHFYPVLATGEKSYQMLFQSIRYLLPDEQVPIAHRIGLEVI
jgi:hypothetical protein